FALKLSSYFHPNLSSRPREGTRTINFQCLLQLTTYNLQPTTNNFPQTCHLDPRRELTQSTSRVYFNRQPTTDNLQHPHPNLSSPPKARTRTTHFNRQQRTDNRQPTTDSRKLTTEN